MGLDVDYRQNLTFGSGGSAQASVVGVPDEGMGEIGVAFVVPAPDEPSTPDGVIAWCRVNMANYEVPCLVQVVSNLPTNASGQVTKLVLRERAPRRKNAPS